MAQEYKVITQDYVNVQISTSKDPICFNERRFQKGIKIIDLKVRNPSNKTNFTTRKPHKFLLRVIVEQIRAPDGCESIHDDAGALR